jgi:hypothetical protein
MCHTRRVDEQRASDGRERGRGFEMAQIRNRERSLFSSTNNRLGSGVSSHTASYAGLSFAQNASGGDARV